MGNNKQARPWRALVLCSAALLALSTAGCQVDVGGQTLPSPYYLSDDVQYFPPGPEFKLAREAAAMKAYNPNPEIARQGTPNPEAVKLVSPPGKQVVSNSP
jgi:hypothetical protein